MNFDLDADQIVIIDLAKRLFDELATPQRVADVERSEDADERGFDRELWNQLANAGVLGLCLPGDLGGSDRKLVDLCLVLEQQGRRVAPVPLLSSVVAAMVVARHGSLEQRAELVAGVASGAIVLTSALASAGANDVRSPSVVALDVAEGVHLTGWSPAVPFAQFAHRVLVPAVRHDGSTLIALVDPGATGVGVAPISTTNNEAAANLTFDTIVPTLAILGNPGADQTAALDRLVDLTIAGLCALSLGVAEGSLAMTAEHVSTRTQFGRPLSAFQAVTQRAADAYITCDAMRLTMLSAAWRLSEGFDARGDLEIAAFWASDGGASVVTAGQHLHGGIGADTDYPVHRYFLWGIQLANTLGSASSHLARLGQLIASR